MLSTLIFVVHLILTIVLVVLMAVQTDKTEQGGGGVMGLGAAGGRSSSNISMAVGAERILKPLTTWVAVGFLASCILNSIPADKLTLVHVVIILAIYFFVMTIGNRIWKAFTRSL